MTNFEIGLVLTLVGLATIVGVLVSALLIECIATEREVRKCRAVRKSAEPLLVFSQSAPRSSVSE